MRKQTEIEKDWNARFELSKSPGLQQYLIWGFSVVLVVACALWAVIILATGLYDSAGNPKNEDIGGRVSIYVFAIAPMVLPGLFIYLHWRMRKKK